MARVPCLSCGARGELEHDPIGSPHSASSRERGDLGQVTCDPGPPLWRGRRVQFDFGQL
jgi:hypothetical protein